MEKYKCIYKKFIELRNSFSKTYHNSHSSQEKGILSSFAVTFETWNGMELNTDKDCNQMPKIHQQLIPLYNSFSKTNHNSHSSKEKGILSSFTVKLEIRTHMESNPD